MSMAEDSKPEAKAFTPDWRILVLLGLALAAAAFVFADLLEDMIEDPLIPLDALVYKTMQGLRTPALDTVMIAITELGDTVVVVSVAAIVAFWLTWRGAWRTLVYWLTAIAGASAINTAIKAALERPRPVELYLQGASNWSFPSGHSTVNAVLYGCFAMIIVRECHPSLRLPVMAAATVLIILIGFSRLYLGAHWASDVFGGLVFAAMWLALLSLFYMYRQAEPVDARGLMIATASALIVAGGANIAFNHVEDTVKYRVRTACGPAALAPLAQAAL
ncbi:MULTISPECIES: phosphatase PAP2 family protein [Asticcacaulis]|uniref:phosphatase PAP2 family protein n=1 Tax=Asticcacaulis TaxID=76890 RepID=UPI001AE772BA|nr:MULTISPECIES: phosphatase PAP2 family protein [Asticcacaulis]MBP2159931.1 membrane-associated phospholipid phosphatase [Asticcacaulis solisilvae]MDR6800976.1 membrane-associated phospholipid phosphatase [Asticcacaulis sp. BE141]